MDWNLVLHIHKEVQNYLLVLDISYFGLSEKLQLHKSAHALAAL